jgi:hypothetical protein
MVLPREQRGGHNAYIVRGLCSRVHARGSWCGRPRVRRGPPYGRAGSVRLFLCPLARCGPVGTVWPSVAGGRARWAPARRLPWRHGRWRRGPFANAPLADVRIGEEMGIPLVGQPHALRGHHTSTSDTRPFCTASPRSIIASASLSCSRMRATGGHIGRRGAARAGAKDVARAGVRQGARQGACEGACQGACQCCCRCGRGRWAATTERRD